MLNATTGKRMFEHGIYFIDLAPLTSAETIVQAIADGLGYLIWHSWQILSLGQSMTGLVATGVLAYALFVALDQIEKILAETFRRFGPGGKLKPAMPTLRALDSDAPPTDVVRKNGAKRS